MADKKQDFVVSDRRRYSSEGEPRTDLPMSEEEQSAPSPAAEAPAAESPAAAPPAVPVGTSAPQAPEQPPARNEAEAEMPAPPTAAEQQEQTDAYQASGKKLDEIFSKTAGGREGLPEMTFERLVESFYMTALLQMGAIRQEGDPPAVDIIGARQTIDSLTILQEKTKGNLTDREQRLLQNVLFELRMAWIEITNALASAKPAGAVPDKKK
jgi:Domain of unknown function (DUF1844)